MQVQLFGQIQYRCTRSELAAAFNFEAAGTSRWRDFFAKSQLQQFELFECASGDATMLSVAILACFFIAIRGAKQANRTTPGGLDF